MMRVKDLVDMLCVKKGSDVNLQVCIKSWKDYATIPAKGLWTDCIQNKEINRIAAISKDVVRIDINWASNTCEYGLPF